MTTSPPSLGTTGSYPPVISVASGPAIVFQWAALLPLVIYLVSQRHTHTLVGKTALAGFIGIGLFPKLGVLSSLADFLEKEADFLDRAWAVSELRRIVWDVNWGSVFPCANGAASYLLSTYALRGVQATNIPDQVKQSSSDEDGNVNKNTTLGASKGSLTSASELSTDFRRYQTLHVLRCTLRRSQSLTCDGSKVSSMVVEFIILLSLLATSILASLFGLFGTATAILISVAFRICRQLIRVERPAGYLRNNEYSCKAGCMLVSIHENASTWYLFTGERGVIDNLLNKSMIHSITSSLGEFGTTALAFTLRLLAVLQLLAMTYVAAQGGWDGVGLLALIIVAWISDYVFYRESQVARIWLRHEGGRIEAKSFKFTGRTSMIGAIQIYKNNNVTTWMDTIIAPCDRRTVWLSKLDGERHSHEQAGVDEEGNDVKQVLEPGANKPHSAPLSMTTKVKGAEAGQARELEDRLNDEDKNWVQLQSSLAVQAAKIMREAFPEEV